MFAGTAGPTEDVRVLFVESNNVTTLIPVVGIIFVPFTVFFLFFSSRDLFYLSKNSREEVTNANAGYVSLKVESFKYQINNRGRYLIPP